MVIASAVFSSTSCVVSNFRSSWVWWYSATVLVNRYSFVSPSLALVMQSFHTWDSMQSFDTWDSTGCVSWVSVSWVSFSNRVEIAMDANQISTSRKALVTALEFLIETSIHPPKIWCQLSGDELVTAVQFLVETSFHPPRKLLKSVSAPSIITNQAKGEDEGAVGGSESCKPKPLKQQSAPLMKHPTVQDLTQIKAEAAAKQREEAVAVVGAQTSSATAVDNEDTPVALEGDETEV